MNREVLQKIKQKNALSRKVVATKDPVIKQEYNKVWNQVKGMTNKLKNRLRRIYLRNLELIQKLYGSILKQNQKLRLEWVKFM